MYKLLTKEQKNMCQGDPIGAGVLVAMMGPPEIIENSKYFNKCHFIQTVQKEQYMCKHTL